MILGWSPFKIVSISAVLYPRWPPLLKIKISSNGQNCSILSQKVPKFELYKHNDKLFNMYYGIFYELWTFADFDRLCKLEKGGIKFKKKSSPLKLLSQSQPNRRTFFLNFIPLFSIFSLAVILDGSRDHRTQFWKGVIQGSFHKSLFAIGPVVSEEKIFMWISHRVLC
jgi:hypothetical protein